MKNTRTNAHMYAFIYIAIAVSLSACQKNGKDGLPGVNQPGQDGHSAAFSQASADSSLCPAGGTVLNAGVDLNDDSFLQMGEIKATAVTCNGQDGTSPTLSPFTPVSLVSACGGSVLDPNNEVFIKLSNGQLIGSVSENVDGKNTHFGVVIPGYWHSTGSNGHECNFTVDSNYNVIN